MAYRPSTGRNQMSSTAPKVPDLVPIMNLFLTIIPFLVLMLVISQVALVAFNFSEGTVNSSENDPSGGALKKDLPEFTVIIMASEDSTQTTYPGFEVRVPEAVAGFPLRQKIGLYNGQYDFAELDKVLKTIKNEYPELKDISVAPYDDVMYEYLMKTIDVCRSNDFPNVKYKALQVRYYGKGA